MERTRGRFHRNPHQAIQLYQRTAIALGFKRSINDFISKEYFEKPFEEPFVPGLELRKWEDVEKMADELGDWNIRAVFRLTFKIATALFILSAGCALYKLIRLIC